MAGTFSECYKGKGCEGNVCRCQWSFSSMSHKTIQDKLHRIIKESSGSCEGKWEQWQGGGSWSLYDTHSATTPTRTTTLQFKYSKGLTFCTCRYRHCGSQQEVIMHFLAVTHLILDVIFSQSPEPCLTHSYGSITCSPTQSNWLHCKWCPHFICILLVLMYRGLIL